MGEEGERLEPQRLWHLLQISDQSFPTGAFAFSHALETYVAHGLLTDRVGCQQLLETLARNALGPCDLVVGLHAYRLAARGAIEAVCDLDRLLDALKLPRELRLESQHTGQALLRAARALTAAPGLATFAERVQHQTTPGHHAIAFAVVAQALELPEDPAWLAYLYQVTAGLVSAAVRLVPLGQTDGQRLLHDLAPTLVEVYHSARTLSPDDAWSCTPGLDVRSMQHERLYSRLFRS